MTKASFSKINHKTFYHFYITIQERFVKDQKEKKSFLSQTML